jgi:hypothetical protein
MTASLLLPPRDQILTYEEIAAIGGLGLNPLEFLDTLFTEPITELRLQLAAMLLTDSYRGCKVSAKVTADDPANRRVGIFWTGNIQLREGDHPERRCAERGGIYKLRENGFPRAYRFGIFGPPQADDATGIQAETIVPCRTCRLDFVAEPEVDGDTQFDTYGPNGAHLHFLCDAFIATYGTDIRV